MKTQPDFAKLDRYKLSSYRAYNEELVERYDSSIWLRVFQASRWDSAIVSQLGAGLGELRVLDVGCATGRLLCKLADSGVRQLAGADLAPRILEVARKKLRDQGAEAELRTADAEDRLPWPDGSFDALLLTGVFHHFFRPRDALQEAGRVLRPGGRIILVDPWFPSPLRGVANFYLRLFPHDGDCSFYSPAAVVRMLQSLGWAEGDYRRVGLCCFLVHARKRSDPPE